MLCISNWKQIQLEWPKYQLSPGLIICTSFNGLSHHIINIAINYTEFILGASKLHIFIFLIFRPDSTNAKYNYDAYIAKRMKYHQLKTHSGLVTTYGDGDLGQHWLSYWLVARRHQAITRNNVNWSSVKSRDMHIRAISQEMPQPSINPSNAFENNLSKISFKLSLGKWD